MWPRRPRAALAPVPAAQLRPARRCEGRRLRQSRGLAVRRGCCTAAARRLFPVMASGFESERSLAARREQRQREREALLAQVGCPARPRLFPGPLWSLPSPRPGRGRRAAGGGPGRGLLPTDLAAVGGGGSAESRFCPGRGWAVLPGGAESNEKQS